MAYNGDTFTFTLYKKDCSTSVVIGAYLEQVNVDGLMFATIEVSPFIISQICFIFIKPLLADITCLHFSLMTLPTSPGTVFHFLQ